MNPPVVRFLEALEAMHGNERWHWDPETHPFEVCAGAILVQNTTWTNAERAVERLRAAGALDPVVIATTDLNRLEDLVRPSGQFRQKARKLLAFAATCLAAGGLECLLALPTPELRRRLLATWGIGPETADCICCYAAGRDVFVVDAYTMRTFRRLGVGPSSDTYEQWQAWLAAAVAPHPRWSGAAGAARAHALIVLHAKRLCRKRQPRCGDCLVRPNCRYANEETGPPCSQGRFRY
ncbi:hypothetical protein [Tepidiforma sp.]|uniref:endonuclease III domain-containing protein n=1 Tax=Tepidiforma sp. TaxID=2682230 RepID=UPI002ADE3D75|nr:hypothetical protein [Tepidiforma sp.]